MVWVDHGRYRGFGFVSTDINGNDALSLARDAVKPYAENKYVHSIIRSYIEHRPGLKMITLKDQEFTDG